MVQKFYDAGGLYFPAVVLVDSTGNTYNASSPTSPTTGTQTSVASAISSTTLLAANTARKGAIIYNDSTSVLYILLSSGTASSTAFSVLLAANGGTLTLGQAEYNGAITGIWATANGFARVTELT